MKKTIVLLLILVNLAAFGQNKLTLVKPEKEKWTYDTYGYQLTVQDSVDRIEFIKRSNGDSTIYIHGDTTKALWMLYKYLMDKPISHFKK